MTKFNDLYKEIISETDISKYIGDINYKLKYKDYLPIIEKYKLVYNKNTKRFDCDNNIICLDDLAKDGKLIIPFGVIDGYFKCSWNYLTSLENCPEIVNGDFTCSHNNITDFSINCKIKGNFYHD